MSKRKKWYCLESLYVSMVLYYQVLQWISPHCWNCINSRINCWERVSIRHHSKRKNSRKIFQQCQQKKIEGKWKGEMDVYGSKVRPWKLLMMNRKTSNDFFPILYYTLYLFSIPYYILYLWHSMSNPNILISIQHLVQKTLSPIQRLQMPWQRLSQTQPSSKSLVKTRQLVLLRILILGKKFLWFKWLYLFQILHH